MNPAARVSIRAGPRDRVVSGRGRIAYRALAIVSWAVAVVCLATFISSFWGEPSITAGMLIFTVTFTVLGRRAWRAGGGTRRLRVPRHRL